MTKLEDREVAVRVTLRRLLAIRTDGQGQHYQFQGFAPRGYGAHARVSSLDGDSALLCILSASSALACSQRI